METEARMMRGDRKEALLAIKVRDFNSLYDLPGVMETELDTEGWDETTFVEFEAVPTSLVRVAIQIETGKVVGHISSTIDSKRKNIVVRRICVKPQFQQKGVGSSLFSDIQKIARRRGAMVLVPVPEKHLEMQLWMKDRGGICFRWDDSEYRPGGLTYWFRA